jgi:transcriptional regulator with XRE-family HTH domain
LNQILTQRTLHAPIWCATLVTMSTSVEGWLIPQWDLADRMAKSLRTAGIGVQQMADYLDMHRNTVGGWLSGRTPPDVRTLRLWALHTGVSYDWLCHGDQHSQLPQPVGVGKRRRAGRAAGPPHKPDGLCIVAGRRPAVLTAA